MLAAYKFRVSQLIPSVIELYEATQIIPDVTQIWFQKQPMIRYKYRRWEKVVMCKCFWFARKITNDVVS